MGAIPSLAPESAPPLCDQSSQRNGRVSSVAGRVQLTEERIDGLFSPGITPIVLALEWELHVDIKRPRGCCDWIRTDCVALRHSGLIILTSLYGIFDTPASRERRMDFGVNRSK